MQKAPDSALQAVHLGAQLVLLLWRQLRLLASLFCLPGLCRNMPDLSATFEHADWIIQGRIIQGR